MAKKFSRMTSLALRQLKAGEKITDQGITFDRLGNGNGRFTINIRVDGQRIHRVVGCESDGTTRTQAEEYIAKIRQDAKNDRLALPGSRKVPLSFSDAAAKYLDRLAQSGGKDLKIKRRRLTQHLVPFFGKMALSKIDSLQIDLYKETRLKEPAMRGGVRRGNSATIGSVANLAKFTRPATINRELAVLSHLLGRAVDWGWIKPGP